MNEKSNRVCPVEKAGSLDNKVRRWIQNPQKVLKPYIKEGMTVLDIGCGPGFFSVDMAVMVGSSGKVIAADLQEEMLRKISEKINATELAERIKLHKCETDRIGVTEQVDFVLLFYVVHEIPKKEQLFNEIVTFLKSTGQVLIVEPPFHVSKSAFSETLRLAGNAGFIIEDGPKMLFQKTAVLKKK